MRHWTSKRPNIRFNLTLDEPNQTATLYEWEHGCPPPVALDRHLQEQYERWQAAQPPQSDLSPAAFAFWLCVDLARLQDWLIGTSQPNDLSILLLSWRLGKQVQGYGSPLIAKLAATCPAPDCLRAEFLALHPDVDSKQVDLEWAAWASDELLRSPARWQAEMESELDMITRNFLLSFAVLVSSGLFLWVGAIRNSATMVTVGGILGVPTTLVALLSLGAMCSLLWEQRAARNHAPTNSQ